MGRVASASDDNTVRLWDPATGEELATLTGHTSGVNAVAWSPEGPRLADITDKGAIWVLDFDCPHHSSYRQGEPLTCLRWADAGIAVGGPRGVGVLDLTYA